MSHSGDAFAVPQRFIKRLSQTDCDILQCVVLPRLHVAFCLDRDIEQTVTGYLLNEVVEHANAGFCLTNALAVERKLHADLGLAGGTVDNGSSPFGDLCSSLLDHRFGDWFNNLFSGWFSDFLIGHLALLYTLPALLSEHRYAPVCPHLYAACYSAGVYRSISQICPFCPPILLFPVHRI